MTLASESGRPRAGRRTADAILTFLAFVVIGPAIGAAAVSCAFLFQSLLEARPVFVFDTLIPYAFRIAWPIGLPAAAVAGLFVALRDWFRGTRFVEALIASAAGGGLWGMFFGHPVFILYVTGASIVAGAVCWWLTRPLRRRG